MYDKPVPFARYLLILLAALVLGTIACSSGDDDAPGVLVPPTSPAVSATPTPGSDSTAQPDSDADAAAEAFLSALTDEDYEAMWGMLPAPTQSLWGTKSALAGFLASKYGGHELDFRLGQPDALYGWTDPDTLLSYATATAVAYAIEIDGAPADAFLLAPIVVVPADSGPDIAGLGPAARRSPVMTPLPETTAAIDMPILVYHHVALEVPSDPEQASITVSTDQFDAELTLLESEGYTTVTAAELVNHLYYSLPLPPKPVLLTFDDGYDDAWANATRLLREHRMTGSFAVVTGFVGGEAYLTWDEVREMRDAGMEIVSHAVTHPDLGALPEEDARAEIVDSKATLEAELGVPVQTLIYPYGEPFAYGTEEAQERIKGVLRDVGYAAAITNPLPNSYPEIHQDGATPYEFNRLMVSPGMSPARFAARLTGAELE